MLGSGKHGQVLGGVRGNAVGCWEVLGETQSSVGRC